MRFHHPSDGSGDTRSLGPDHAFAGELAVRTDVHVTRRGQRRGLTIIESGSATIRHSYHHVATATQIPRLGVGNGESKAGRNRCIDRVSALLHHFGADVRGKFVVARDNGVGCESRPGTGGKTPASRKNGGDALRYGRIVRGGSGRRRRRDPDGRDDGSRDENELSIQRNTPMVRESMLSRRRDPVSYRRTVRPPNPIRSVTLRERMLLVLLTPFESPLRS
jgi:hypothetical protein